VVRKASVSVSCYDSRRRSGDAHSVSSGYLGNRSIFTRINPCARRPYAYRDTALQRTALHLPEKAVGAGDASSHDLAYLTDRVRAADGLPQVYGTQLQYDSRGCASPKPSEDPTQLDARRASVGLEPVAQYVQTVMAALGRATQCAAPK
jgi:hypothetical protein